MGGVPHPHAAIRACPTPPPCHPCVPYIPTPPPVRSLPHLAAPCAFLTPPPNRRVRFPSARPTALCAILALLLTTQAGLH